MKVFLIFVIFCTSLNVFGAGNIEKSSIKEPFSYDQVEQLINEKQYNKAIKLLVNIAKANPEQMELVQQKILKIREYHGDINNLFYLCEQALIQENFDLAYHYAYMIEDLDQDDNSFYKDETFALRGVIEREVNYQDLDKIFSNAQIFTANNQFNFAIEEYLNGFSLYKDLFENYTNGNIYFTERYSDKNEKYSNMYNKYGLDIIKVIEDVEKIVREWNNSYDENLVKMENYLDSYTGEEFSNFKVNPVVDIYYGYFTKYRFLSEISMIIENIDHSFLEELGGPSIEFWLAFVYQIINGRFDSENEGILYTIESFIEYQHNNTLNYLDNRLTTATEDQRDNILLYKEEYIRRLEKFMEIYG